MGNLKNLSDLINELVEKKMQIEQFKKDHPEQGEIVQMVEDYTALFDEVCRQCQQSTPTYIPYPVYPNPYLSYPYQWVCGAQGVTVKWDVGTVDRNYTTCSPIVGF